MWAWVDFVPLKLALTFLNVSIFFYKLNTSLRSVCPLFLQISERLHGDHVRHIQVYTNIYIHIHICMCVCIVFFNFALKGGVHRVLFCAPLPLIHHTNTDYPAKCLRCILYVWANCFSNRCFFWLFDVCSATCICLFSDRVFCEPLSLVDWFLYSTRCLRAYSL